LPCKSSLVEQGVRSPPNNLYYLNHYLTINPRSYPHYILWHWIAFSPLQLDPYWKLVLNAYTYVPIPKNYQIALIWSPNLHHGQIHIKKTSPRCR
jgi:hypothetical protein